jgi:hypothetical protein
VATGESPARLRLVDVRMADPRRNCLLGTGCSVGRSKNSCCTSIEESRARSPSIPSHLLNHPFPAEAIASTPKTRGGRWLERGSLVRSDQPRDG